MLTRNNKLPTGDELVQDACSALDVIFRGQNKQFQPLQQGQRPPNMPSKPLASATPKAPPVNAPSMPIKERFPLAFGGNNAVGQ